MSQQRHEQFVEGGVMKSVITGILVAIFAAALGFGASQATLAIEVKSHTVELQHLKEMDAKLSGDLSDERALQRELLKQNQEFINLLRIQNELLAQKRNTP